MNGGVVPLLLLGAALLVVALGLVVVAYAAVAVLRSVLRPRRRPRHARVRSPRRSTT